MAQAVGGRYGLPHGTLNGICLPPALRFNARYAPEAVRRFGEAVGGATRPRASRSWPGSAAPPASATSACRRTIFRRLAEAAAQRAGNQANPHPATPAEIEQLLRSVW